MSRKRVVVLSRAGSARDRTEAAIVQAGADVAALLDPATASEADVRNATPDVLLVILDAQVEQALEKFDDVLGDPALEILFDDADVAAKRDGWETARWARHLQAKLHGHDDVLPPARDAAAAPAVADGDPPGFQAEMEALSLQVAAMPDVPQARPPASSTAIGAVVIVAGIGGPDAVRQLLGGLPPGFPRPVVLRQRIEGGQYDKLVRQMQRAAQMQVVLAQAGDVLQAGTVHVLPDGLDIQAAPAGLVFAPTDGEPAYAALRAEDSALLLLSGADVALVDQAMAMRWAGGLVAGQSADHCFDPAASNALVARGGEALGLAQLAQKLLQRWPA
ncbi:MAG TPA: chemotaxis protein CheB [Thermomonas sp.]|nr:chemotaxis protein CheB [Thermomonas sp.]